MAVVHFGGDRRSIFATQSKSTKRKGAHQVARAALEALEARLVLSAPPLPVIPSGAGHLFVVTAAPFNAVGDGTTDNTAAIQAAINAANAAGGGTVEIPAAAGDYECGAFSMKSNVNLQVDSGATLQATAALGGTVWISVTNVSNWEISGTGSGATMGALDGHADGGIGSLNMMRLSGASTGLIQTIQVNNSPHEHIQCGTGLNTNITINGVTINTPADTANTDGIDPAGQNWLIENCTISDGDDDIALKPQLQFCTNIDIENCTILAGHGISIGGQTQDGLNGMIVNNCTFNGTDNGLRLKAGEGNGGTVVNVTYSNITMTNVINPIVIDSYYNNGSNNFPTDPTADLGSTPDSLTPIWGGIHFINITSTNSNAGSNAGIIFGLPDEPIVNLTFANVKITAPVGMEINHVQRATFDSNCQFTIASGNDLVGVTGGTFPVPVDAQITEDGYLNAMTALANPPFDISPSLFDPTTGDWTLNGPGTGISATSDSFDYSFQTISGDSTFTAELTSLQNNSSSPTAVAEAGVMDRLSTISDDSFAGLVKNSNNQILFEWRATVGGPLQTSAPVADTSSSVFLRIERSGNTYTAFFSDNGSTFTQVGTPQTITTIDIGANVGIFADSGDNTATATADFSNVVALNSVPTPGPSVVNSAAAGVSAAGTSINLSALGDDPAGESGLTYTWSATGVPQGVSAPVFDANNGQNAGKNETATVSGIGQYTFLVTIANADNLSTTSSVTITVNQVATSLQVSPSGVTLDPADMQPFTAMEFDQFDNTMASPPTFTWSLDSGVGSIDPSTGVYTAPNTGGGSAVVRATAGSVTNTASVTINSIAINLTPTVATPAAALPSEVDTGTTTALSVLGADDGGEANLIYTWAVTSGPTGVTFSDNGDNASKNGTATFTQAGSYTFTVTIEDTGGLSTTNTVDVTVDQTATTLQITPPSVAVDAGGNEPFSAIASDQFGNAMTTPPAFTWSLDSGVGSIDPASGEYTAPTSGGPDAVVRATAGAATNTASVTINTTATNEPPTVAVAAAATPGEVTGISTALSALGDDDGGESNLIYTWAVTSGPSGVTFSSNGTNDSKNTTATFAQAGAYTFTATIQDTGGMSTTSTVDVTVDQTLTMIVVTPSPATVATGATQQFSATTDDQFGNAMETQPTSFEWAVTAGSVGTISITGQYSAGATTGMATVQATSDAVTGSASVDVTAAGTQPPPEHHHHHHHHHRFDRFEHRRDKHHREEHNRNDDCDHHEQKEPEKYSHGRDDCR